MKTKLPLIAMLFTIFAFAQSPGDVIVSEIFIDPNGDERALEWFEVYNTTGAAIDINGWIINDESSNGRDHVIVSATPVMVPANDYAVLVSNDDSTVNGGITNAIYEYGYESPRGGPATPGMGTQFPTWNNESTYIGGSTNDDGITLETASGTIIDQIFYGFGYAGLNAWPAMGAAQDVTYQLDASTLDSASNDIATNWLPSTAVFDSANNRLGTPGTANFGTGGTPALGPGDIVVTEIMIDPGGDERAQEWFEVLNTTSTAIDINGWVINDESSNGRAHVITSATPVMVPANSYAVLVSNDDPTLNGGITNAIYEYGYNSPIGGPATPGTGTDFPTWNNETTYIGGSTNDDGIRLETASGTVIDQILYGFGFAGLNAWPAMGASQDVSYQLSPSALDDVSNDLAVNWIPSTATYGTDNQLGTPGVQNTLSVESAQLGTLKLFPNPATNFLSIEIENANWTSLTIFNLAGQELINVNEYTDRVNVSTLKTGTYFVKVNAALGTETIQFLVK